MKTQDAKNEFYLYSFTCQFLVWMQRPDRRALGASAKPIREVQDRRPSVPENGMLAPQTCIRRMCTCTSGLVVPQFRRVHNKIRWFYRDRLIRLFLKMTSFKQSIELLTRDQCTPLLKFPFSTEDRINDNFTKNPTNKYQAQVAQCGETRIRLTLNER